MSESLSLRPRRGDVRDRRRGHDCGFRPSHSPVACYLEFITIGDAAGINRNDQLEKSIDNNLSNRPYRLANGEVNLSGDWAQEQYVIAAPPSGAGVGLVPKSMKPGIESGELTAADVPSSGWNSRPVTYTWLGEAEAEFLRQNTRQRSSLAMPDIRSGAGTATCWSSTRSVSCRA